MVQEQLRTTENAALTSLQEYLDSLTGEEGYRSLYTPDRNIGIYSWKRYQEIALRADPLLMRYPEPTEKGSYYVLVGTIDKPVSPFNNSFLPKVDEIYWIPGNIFAKPTRTAHIANTSSPLVPYARYGKPEQQEIHFLERDITNSRDAYAELEEAIKNAVAQDERFTQAYDALLDAFIEDIAELGQIIGETDQLQIAAYPTARRKGFGPNDGITVFFGKPGVDLLENESERAALIVIRGDRDIKEGAVVLRVFKDRYEEVALRRFLGLHGDKFPRLYDFTYSQDIIIPFGMTSFQTIKAVVEKLEELGK